MASSIHDTMFADPQLVPFDTKDPFSLGTLTSGPEGAEHNEDTAQSIFGQPYDQAKAAEVTGISHYSDNHDASNNSIQSILEDHWADKDLDDNDLPSAPTTANHDLVTKSFDRDWDGTTNDYFSEHFIRDSIPQYQLERLAVPGFENYDLRLAPRLGGPGPSCYLDQDQTDDFDPKKPGIIDAVPLKRKRESLYEEGYGPRIRATPRGPSRITYQHGRNVGKSLTVKLKFTTICGKEMFPTYEKNPALQSRSPSNDGSSDLDSGFWSASHSSSDTSPSTHEQYTQRRLRKAAMPQETADDEEDDETLKLEDLTLGHPAARGCKPCFKLGLECPLLTRDASYPCFNCREDHTDCELVLPPEKKRSCEDCRNKHIQCSYRHEGSDHSKACDYCFTLGHNCVAGPFRGRMRTGPALQPLFSLSGQSAKHKPAPATQHKSSTGANSENGKVAKARRTSAPAIHPNHEDPISAAIETRHGADQPLASATSNAATKKIERQRFIDALLHPVPRPQAPPAGQPSKPSTTLRQQKIHHLPTPVPRQPHHLPIQPFPRPRLPTPKKQQRQIQTVGGIMAPLPQMPKHGYTITNPYTPQPAPFHLPTRLAHPIQLNFLPSPISPACHFHPLGIYPLLGLPPLTPLVRDTPSAGYTELHGGHVAAGFPPSRMCPDCTAERLRVLKCGGHEMEVLGEGEGRPCAVCVGEAGYRCCGGVGGGGSGEGGAGPVERKKEEEKAGCGLHLCERCAVRLVGGFDASLEALVEAMLRENDGGMGWGVRADVEMLLGRGEVGRRLLGR